MKAFINGKIFTGNFIEENKTVLVDGEKIISVTPEKNFTGPDVIDLKNNLLVPAFIDMQIYGGNNYLFGEFPSVKSLQATYEYCLSGGAAHFLPTIATNRLEVMLQGIQSVKEYWHNGGKGVIGLHLEGPYISEVKRGAHLKQFIRKPTAEETGLLIEKGKGVIKMITLAPEVCDEKIIRLLRQNNIIISAGHSNAGYTEVKHAFDKGIKTATHLYNAMSPLHHREPGMVGAVLDAGDVSVSIVADGHHVDYAAIRIAKKILGDKLFLITDAVTENITGTYRHHLRGDKYIMPDGTLSGSSLTMLQAVKNCVHHAGIDLEEALRMASLYPARVLSMEKQRARIEKNYDADFIVLSPALDLKAVYTNGKFTGAV